MQASVVLDDIYLPMVFSSLKLLQMLRTLFGENEDLDDAWVESNSELYEQLLELLRNSGRK